MLASFGEWISRVVSLRSMPRRASGWDPIDFPKVLHQKQRCDAPKRLMTGGRSCLAFPMGRCSFSNCDRTTIRFHSQILLATSWRFEAMKKGRPTETS